MARDLRRIGIFGGTFDPPHLGHFLMADYALEHANLDRLFFVPCRRSPHKHQSPVGCDHRLPMLQLACGNHPKIEISSFELNNPPPSYSLITVNHFKQKYPSAELFWVLGSDQWKAIRTWYKVEALAPLITFLIFPRPTAPRPKQGFKHITMDFRVDITSSEVRERLRRNQSLRYFVPESIEQYILQHQIYL